MRKSEEQVLELRVQVIASGVITALLIWVGATVAGSRTDIARLEERMTGLEQKISELKMQNQEVRLLQNRVAILEQQMKGLHR